MSVYNNNGEIRAAGGVVLKMGRGGPQVLLVHRPVYDDWSLPKGKLKRGEKDTRAALREVAEETGLTCDLEIAVGEMHYRDRKGRPKCAQYWAMIPRSGRFRSNGEVDSCEWLDLRVAAKRLSRSGDREFLGRLARLIRCRKATDRFSLEMSGYIVVHESE